MISFGDFGKLCIDSDGWVSSACETGGSRDGIAVSFGAPQHMTVRLSEAFIMRAFHEVMSNKERAADSGGGEP